MKDVLQVTFENDEQFPVERTVLMGLHRTQFLVKNFTEEPINVTLGDNDTHSIIPAKSWERVFNNIDNERGKPADSVNELTIEAFAEGIVEIASIDF